MKKFLLGFIFLSFFIVSVSAETTDSNQYAEVTVSDSLFGGQYSAGDTVIVDMSVKNINSNPVRYSCWLLASELPTENNDASGIAHEYFEFIEGASFGTRPDNSQFDLKYGTTGWGQFIIRDLGAFVLSELDPGEELDCHFEAKVLKDTPPQDFYLSVRVFYDVNALPGATNEPNFEINGDVSIVSPSVEPLYDTKGNVFKEYIRNLYQDEVIGGYSDGSFKPDESVSRGAFSKFIKNAFGFETNTSCGDFSDVSSDHTFYEHITTLKCEGVIGGYGDGTFRSEELVSRGAATKFIINAARVKTGDEDFFTKTDDDVFPDVIKDNVFYEYIMSAYSNGIVNGQSDGSFNPDGEMTRGATSKVIDISRKEL